MSTIFFLLHFPTLYQLISSLVLRVLDTRSHTQKHFTRKIHWQVSVASNWNLHYLHLPSIERYVLPKKKNLNVMQQFGSAQHNIVCVFFFGWFMLKEHLIRVGVDVVEGGLLEDLGGG